MDDSDVQFCIIGSLLYKSAPLHSTSPSRWYMSKKFHLNVTLRACQAEDHSKCQNSLMWPMTEFRISLCHIFLKQISKAKLCLWNLDSALCCYSVSFPLKVQTLFFSLSQLSRLSTVGKAMRNFTVEHILLTSFKRINVNHGCILNSNIYTNTNSFTECRGK